MKKKTKKVKLTAKTADKFELYEASVQTPDVDVAFVSKLFKKKTKRAAMSLREDFCGTGAFAAEWVRSKRERTAVGLDLCEETLAVAQVRQADTLKRASDRLHFVKGDVLEGTQEKSDVIVAFNFSYCCFKERETLLAYFKRARNDLNADGCFALDIHGGVEVFAELEEETDHKRFSYVWDQEPYDPINGYAFRKIHFRFPDGTEMKDAFVYDWRLWGLAEMRDILRDAGFSDVVVYWEGTTKKGDGDGIFSKADTGVNDDAWIAYVVAWR